LVGEVRFAHHPQPLCRGYTHRWKV
jgi:hypothetical protein